MPYAAHAGMLPAMWSWHSAHELGPTPAFRINLAALGLGSLDEGLARRWIPKRRADHLTFSALRRVGNLRCGEHHRLAGAGKIAPSTAKVVALNGGI